MTDIRYLSWHIPDAIFRKPSLEGDSCCPFFQCTTHPGICLGITGVDVQELLHTSDFDHQNLELLDPLPREGGGYAYPVFTDAFSLSGFDLKDYVPQSVTYAGDVHILLCTGGEVQIMVEETGECVVVQQGQSVCIPGCIGQWSVSGHGMELVARTGVESAS